MGRTRIPTLTVAALIEALKNLDQSLVVVASSDAEGNSFSPVTELSLGAYDGSESTFGISELTDEYRKQGYTEEDVIKGPKAVCLWVD